MFDVSIAMTTWATSRGGLPVVDLAPAIPTGVDAVVTTRHGGVGRAPYDSLNLGDHVGDDPAVVSENRRRVSAAMGVAPSALVLARQVHGATVLDLDHWSGGPLVGDALFTTRDDLALAILVADCVPVLFVAPDGAAIAVAHAGWRGLAAGVLHATLRHFDATTVRVVVGPHISATRYQVGPEVSDHFADVPGAVREDVGDRRLLDLGAVTRHQLRDAGVDERRVVCVASSSDDTAHFFSDRAARPCGRFALVARRRPAERVTRGAE